MTVRWMSCFGVIVVCAALIVGPSPAAVAAGPNVVHVPAELFAAGGPLGSLGINDCRIVLADGPGGSLLRVSKAMAGLGFRDIPFTVPPLEEEVAFGPLATTLRLRIPGRDPGDPSTTIQSASVTTRIAGASIELTAVFEPQGPEMTGEYYAVDPGTGKGGWVHALDVEADGLTVTVSFPIRARGVELGLGEPTVTTGFSFAVSASGWAGLALDGTFAKDMVKSAIERALANALKLDAYRVPLAAALGTWLREGPFQGLKLREIRLQPTADGGLDLIPITTSDP
ncbi:MAG: hypothetical protein ACYC9Y_07470 [Candidatus Methylomirabilia bacterium]